MLGGIRPEFAQSMPSKNKGNSNLVNDIHGVPDLRSRMQIHEDHADRMEQSLREIHGNDIILLCKGKGIMQA